MNNLNLNPINNLDLDKRKKLEKLIELGFETEYDDEAECFMIFTDESKEHFIPFSNEMYVGDNYSFDLIPYYSTSEKNPKKILSRHKAMPKGKFFNNDNEAIENLLNDKLYDTNVALLFENKNIAEIISILDDKSEIAKKALAITNELIENGILEKPAIVENRLVKKNVLGEDNYCYAVSQVISLYSKPISGKRVKYSITPYALSKDDISLSNLEIIWNNNEESDNCANQDFKEVIRKIRQVDKTTN